ncbi:MAG: insulinase family protein [Eubacterium sp.]|nr:insulinase family protein [Eubacterium sp.]
MNFEQLTSYEVIKITQIHDLKSQGILLRHKKSGARVNLILNDDENKVFYIAFRTPPVNSTGLTHILEHCVLCGSKEFPIKDPFIELVKGSLNTFLNAITYPDKTVYPVASCNDKDFQNLIHVYMDAVFYPNIYKYKEIFCQEGWHYELKDKDAELKINGVVYNEMKGAFSSADDVLEREILNSLYPDTAYQFESGGDPKNIPDLSYEEFLDFHSKYYHPSNSYIYLYGNMDAIEKLQWMDEYYLSKYDLDDFDTTIAAQAPFEVPVHSVKKYSIGSNESTEDKTYLSCSWSIGNSLERERYLAFEVLDYALLNSQGAPVKKALIDAGIGKDIQGGYDNGLYQPIFSIIAKNANSEDKERFLTIIRETLEEQVKNGIDQEALLASINNAEFKYRELDFGNYPKGLILGLNAMDSWLYDDMEPFMHLELLDTYKFLREQVGTGYYENLVQECMLDNNHISIITMEPEQGLTAKDEKALAEKLAAYKASLSEEEIDEIVAFTKQLEDYQDEPNSEEGLATIPMLAIEDIKKEVEPFDNQVIDADGIPVLWHDIETNGIVYLDLMFDTKYVSEELVPYLGLLRLLLGYLDTENYSYSQFANEVNLHMGSQHNSVTVFPHSIDTYKYQVKFETRVCVLEEKLDKAFELVSEMLFKTSLSDDKRLKELLSQMKSSLEADLSGSGHIVSATRALGYYLPRSKYSDMTTGIDFYRLVKQIETDFDNQKEDLKKKLTAIMGMVFNKENLMVNITCKEAGREKVLEQLGKFQKQLYPLPADVTEAVITCEPCNEGFKDASQIQYVSQVGSYIDQGYEYTGALKVLKTILSYDYLWQNIRVKGGAYGCAAAFTRTGDAYFTTYRDPKLAESLDVFAKTVDYLNNFKCSDRDMTKYVIGTISGMDLLLYPKAKGRRSMMAYLAELTEEMIQKERDEVIGVTIDDIRSLAGLMQAILDKKHICVIGNEGKVQENQALFDKVADLF